MNPHSKLAKQSRCEDCEQKIDIANYYQRDGFTVLICGVCDGDCSPCQGCKSHNVTLSDYGVDLCPDCQKNASPESKRWLAEEVYNDMLESGRI